MSAPPNWLEEVVILNDSNGSDIDESIPGDVSIYRSEGDALRELEPWAVEHSHIFAFNAAGKRLVLGVSEAGQVIIARREGCPDGSKIVLKWLTFLAQSIVDARVRVAQKGRVVLSTYEEAGLIPTTVEGLIAYIGFPWTGPRNWFAPGCLLLLALNAALCFILIRHVL
ncbi:MULTISPECIES: hypothetical protein [unclassified Sphingobium]|uniref:hypothetical protein n=1 Tax=unclassified Sphingobium TaxID=2611147 RepID=UPI0035A6E5C8